MSKTPPDLNSKIDGDINSNLSLGFPDANEPPLDFTIDEEPIPNRNIEEMLDNDEVEVSAVESSSPENPSRSPDIGYPSETVLIPINMDDIFEMLEFNLLYEKKEEKNEDISVLQPLTNSSENIQIPIETKGEDENEAMYKFRQDFISTIRERSIDIEPVALAELSHLVTKKVYFGVTYLPEVESWMSVSLASIFV